MKLNPIVALGLAMTALAGCHTVHRASDTKTSSIGNEQVLATNADGPASEDVSQADSIANVAYFQDEDPTSHSVTAVYSHADSSPIIPAEPQQLTTTGMTLAQFEALALENNPTIQELVATTRKAAGYRTQVGLRPNPIVGYQANQLADQQTDQHTAFLEQEFVRGGKLELNWQVLNETLRAQLLELETQQHRVTTDVRVKFYEVLGAQRRLQLISDFVDVVDKGFRLSESLLDAGEATKIDVLQSKIQKNEIELAERQAQVAFESAWRELTALTGVPELPPTEVTGELPNQVDSQDWNELASMIVASSPEYAAAQARINRARANLRRQGVQSIPNITAQLAAGFDNATDSGMINLQIGAPIPVFNQNQGNIAAARAEYCRAVKDSERIENAIKARLAAVSKDFDSSLAAIRQYADEILPSAQESLGYAETSYQAGETSFVQVLVARRTYFDSNLQFVTAQTQLAQAQAKVEGNVLTGGLDEVRDESGDDSLRGLTFSQQ